MSTMNNSKKVFVYFGDKKLVQSSNEALQFVEDCNLENNPHSKSMFAAIFDNEFKNGYKPHWFNFKRIELAVPGIGPNRIFIYPALADTLEEHDLIVEKEEKEKAEEAEKERAESFQKRMSEMLEENKGWYVVELPCCQQDFRKGGHKERWTNWKVLANSQMDAYNKAVDLAEEKGFFWFRDAENCQIDFYGVWTDEKEEMLREEGLA